MSGERLRSLGTTSKFAHNFTVLSTRIKFSNLALQLQLTHGLPRLAHPKAEEAKCRQQLTSRHGVSCQRQNCSNFKWLLTTQ